MCIRDSFIGKFPQINLSLINGNSRGVEAALQEHRIDLGPVSYTHLDVYKRQLRTFPSKVQITFQVGLKRFRSIKASDFIINISYEELLKLGSDKYTVKLKSFPSGINQIRIVPEQVDFLIEQITSNVD